MSAKNSDLVALQKQLIALVDDLSRQQEEAQTIEAVKAISREIAEVNHRVTMVGQVVFTQRTEKIMTAIQAVRDGTKAVDDAIESSQKLNAFIKTITRFLGLVDKVVDVAKLVA
jgi:prophage DNA circulation protein